MNAPLTVVNIPSLQMVEAELLAVLGSSIYPGAKPESMKMVIGYCRAANLDPMQKPVHIVPMDVKTDKKDNSGKAIYEKRDVIMPGIGLYRVNAVRTGAYAGVSDPQFGPTNKLAYKAERWEDNKKTYVNEEIEYPESCRVTVRRIVQGQIVEFSATELWKENYATASKYTEAPNSMWKRRPFAQLAKCAEAQALRKAFPEIGAQPTAEEMEGRTLDPGDETVVGSSTTAAAQIEQPRSKSGEEKPAATDQAKPATVEKKPISPGALKTIRKQMENAALSEVDAKAKFGHDADGVVIENWTLESLDMSEVNAVLAWVKNPAGAA